MRATTRSGWASAPVTRGSARRPGYRPRVSRQPWAHQPGSRATSARKSTRPDLVRGDPAERLARFLGRVERLTPDELDRLAAAEPPPIAFLATVRRFLSPDAMAAFADAEAALVRRVPPDRWAEVGLREGLLGVAAELVLAAFLDDLLAEPFRGRARDRLLRAWEASLDQPRYGPNGAGVEAVRDRVRLLTREELAAFVRASQGIDGADRPWPESLDREEDEALRISALLAERDVAAAVPVAGLATAIGDPGSQAGCAPGPRDGAPARVPAGRSTPASSPRSRPRSAPRRPRHPPRTSAGPAEPVRPPRVHAGVRSSGAWTLLVIGFAGLVGALVAALFVLRRRAEQVELLRERLRAATDQGAGRPAALAGDEADRPAPGRRAPVRRGGPGRRGERPCLTPCSRSRPAGSSGARSWRRSSTRAWSGVLAGLADGGSATTELRTGDGEPRTVLVRARRDPGGDDRRRPRGRHRAPPAPADPDRVHRQPEPRAADAAVDGQPARRDARARRRARRRPGADEGADREVEVETGHLVQMVNELLDLARIEGGSQLRMDENVDLGRLAEASAERLRLFAERQGVTIAVEVAPDVPLVRGRRGPPRPGVRQPRPQRGEVQPRGRRGRDRRPAPRATSSPSP